MTKPVANLLAIALRSFLSDHLPRVRGMSPHTIQSYRDGLVLLLRFTVSHGARPAERLELEDISSDRVVAFLDHLERDRGNSAATRNVRLAAVHAFFRYVAARHPDRLEQSQRVLAIPFKRARSKTVPYLEFDELQAVFSTVDRTIPDGRRDYALLATMFNTGARVQEALDLRVRDLQLVKPYQARLFGKGRKERLCPLWPQTAEVLRAFLNERGLDDRSASLVFLNHNGKPLTRFGVRYILSKYLLRAQAHNPSLAGKRFHPHCLRHSSAVHLLKAGVDLVTIAHWLGHSSVNTTNKYAAVDLATKRTALAQASPLEEQLEIAGAWRRDASILDWLESL